MLTLLLPLESGISVFLDVSRPSRKAFDLDIAPPHWLLVASEYETMYEGILSMAKMRASAVEEERWRERRDGEATRS